MVEIRKVTEAEVIWDTMIDTAQEIKCIVGEELQKLYDRLDKDFRENLDHAKTAERAGLVVGIDHAKKTALRAIQVAIETMQDKKYDHRRKERNKND
jgi:hypothetical protein